MRSPLIVPDILPHRPWVLSFHFPITLPPSGTRCNSPKASLYQTPLKVPFAGIVPAVTFAIFALGLLGPQPVPTKAIPSTRPAIKPFQIRFMATQGSSHLLQNLSPFAPFDSQPLKPSIWEFDLQQDRLNRDTIQRWGEPKCTFFGAENYLCLALSKLPSCLLGCT